MSQRAIVITGASAGMGRALAQHYAKPGTVLGLVGRDAETLDQTVASCRARGAEVETIRLDVRDGAALAQRLITFDSVHSVDLLVANAGAALPEDDEAAARAVFDTNLGGTLNTCLPLLPAMLARGGGQIAFMSSIAALSPLPDAAAYSGSKAAILAYGLALRQKLRAGGIRVSVICPGFVATGMGARYSGWRPLELSAEAAATRIAAGLASDRAVIAFPWPLYAAARLGTIVPEPLLRLAMKAFSFSIDRPAR